MILPNRPMFGDGARGKHTAADYVSGLIRSSGRRRSRAGVTGVILIDQVREGFARAQEPKALEVYPCGHFGLYPGRPFHEAAERATGWFGRWL